MRRAFSGILYRWKTMPITEFFEFWGEEWGFRAFTPKAHNRGLKGRRDVAWSVFCRLYATLNAKIDSEVRERDHKDGSGTTVTETLSIAA